MNLDQFIHQNGLPRDFAQSVERCYLRYADRVAARVAENHGDTYVLWYKRSSPVEHARCAGNALASAEGADAIMSDEQIARFIQFYERLTRNNIEVLPSKADAVIELGDDHQAVSLNFRDVDGFN